MLVIALSPRVYVNKINELFLIAVAVFLDALKFELILIASRSLNEYTRKDENNEHK